MFEKILVCLDGSAVAEQMLPYLTEEAVSFKSDITLFRVANLPGITIPISIPGEPGIPMSTAGAIRRATDEENEAADYLARIAEPMREKGLNVESVVLPGIAGETITSYAAENGFTLIAIASHGHGGLRRLAFGSTADFVLRHSSLPILMVRVGA
ncbi:universal stress protein [Chloroflexota bacterium]